MILLDTNIIIAETIIVGDIPRVVANVNPSNAMPNVYENELNEPIN